MDWNARMTALVAALAAVNTSRIVGRNFQRMSELNDTDLELGVFTVMSSSASGLHRPFGVATEASRQKVLIIGQLRVPNSSGSEGDGAAVEAAEFSMMADLEALVSSQLAENISGIEWLGVTQSRQLDAPYGWIAAEFEIGP